MVEAQMLRLFLNNFLYSLVFILLKQHIALGPPLDNLCIRIIRVHRVI